MRCAIPSLPEDKKHWHKYGAAWLLRSLPEGFDDSLIALLERIKAAEAKRLKVKKTKKGDAAILDIMEEEGIDANMLDACKAYLDNIGGVDLSDFQEAYAGQYSSDEEFAQDMAEQLGSINKDATWPNNSIDWEQAARELMYDYFESNGYYFRNM